MKRENKENETVREKKQKEKENGKVTQAHK